VSPAFEASTVIAERAMEFSGFEPIAEQQGQIQSQKDLPEEQVKSYIIMIDEVKLINNFLGKFFARVKKLVSFENL